MSVLHFSDEFLQTYGCSNCVWKDLDQCPEGFTLPSESLPEGYCSKVPNFFMSISSDGDSLSAVKEKFHLFLQEVQALQDRKDYKSVKLAHSELKSEIASLQADNVPVPSSQLSRLHTLEAEMNGYKIWWTRLSESVVRGLARVADRESRRPDDSRPRLSVQEFNKILQTTRSGALPDKTVGREGSGGKTVGGDISGGKTSAPSEGLGKGGEENGGS